MTEQNKEQAYRQIIEELFDIIAHATLNVGAWPQVDELQARYQKLQAEEPTARPDTPESDDEEEARAEAYWRKNEQQEDEAARGAGETPDDGWSDKLAERGY